PAVHRTDAAISGTPRRAHPAHAQHRPLPRRVHPQPPGAGRPPRPRAAAGLFPAVLPPPPPDRWRSSRTTAAPLRRSSTRTRPPTPVRRRRTGAVGGRPHWSSRAVVNVPVLLAVLYCLGPLLWLLMASTKNAEALFASSLFSTEGFALLGNIRQLVTEADGVYLRWYANSLLYAFVGAAV